MTTLRLTREDTGRFLSVKTRSDILLCLAENPTTGYRWELEDVDSKVLQVGGSSFDQDSVAAGVGGIRTFHCETIGNGVTKLRAKLWRPWQGDSSVTERFDVTVEVTQ